MNRKPRWLVVDDSAPLARRTSEALIDAGAEVVGVAFDGAQALNLFERLCPDALAMDVNMPRLSGLEVARAVRGMERRPSHASRCVIALLTFHAGSELREVAIASGADACIDKAHDFESLIGLVAPIEQGTDRVSTDPDPQTWSAH